MGVEIGGGNTIKFKCRPRSNIDFVDGLLGVQSWVAARASALLHIPSSNGINSFEYLLGIGMLAKCALVRDLLVAGAAHDQEAPPPCSIIDLMVFDQHLNLNIFYITLIIPIVLV